MNDRGAVAEFTAAPRVVLRYRAVIIESSALLRRGIAALLHSGGIDCVAAAQSGIDGHHAASEHQADIVVVGNCPDSTHLKVLDRLRLLGGLRIVVITPITDLLSTYGLYQAGAIAVVHTDACDAELMEMLSSVVQGHRYVPANLLVDALDRPGRRVNEQQDFDLTSREREVLAQLATGRSNKEIAKELCIGIETVKSHLNNIYAKFSVSRRGQAVSLAMEHRLL